MLIVTQDILLPCPIQQQLQQFYDKFIFDIATAKGNE